MNHTKSEKRKKDILEIQLRRHREQIADLKRGKRKTIDVHYVQGDYGHGFEDVAAYDTRIEAMEGLREYNNNDKFVPYRYIVKRVKKANYESGNYAKGGEITEAGDVDYPNELLNYAKGGDVKHECGLSKEEYDFLIDFWKKRALKAKKNKDYDAEYAYMDCVINMMTIKARRGEPLDANILRSFFNAKGGELMDADTEVQYAKGGDVDDKFDLNYSVYTSDIQGASSPEAREIIAGTYNDVIGDINEVLRESMYLYGNYSESDDDFMKDFYLFRRILGKEISRLSYFAKGGDVKDKKFTFNKVEDKERFYEGGNISQVSKVGDPDYPTYEL